MQYIRKWICILLSALMLMSALSGCQKETEESDETDERFVVRASLCDAVASLDPAMNVDGRAESLFLALYENLMRTGVDADGKVTLEPGIAKEYQEIQNYDGTAEYVFTLRSTARWSDGTRVKARDFVYAWKRLVDPQLDSPNSDLLSMVQGYDEARSTGDLTKLAVKADGDTTLRVTLRAPSALFLSDVCTAVATMPLRGDQESKNPNWTSSAAVLCNGPYQVGVWAKESYIQLRRNTSYYDNRTVTPDTLRLYFTRSEGEAWQLYMDGGVDYAAVPPGRADATAYPPLRSVCCVLYNHMSDLFSNAHLRRAFDLTLDRAAIATAAGPGMRPATGYVPEGVMGVSREEDFRAEGGVLCAVDEESYATRCMEAESEMRLGDYWGGVDFPGITCIYPASDELRAVASKAAATWNDKLKISVSVEPLDPEEYDRRIREGEYDLAIGVISAKNSDALSFLGQFAGTDANNALHYVNKPFDLLIGVAESSHDLAARSAMLHDAEALLLEDAALSPLYFGSTAYMLRDSLTGVRYDLRGNVYFTGVTRVDG